MKNRNTASELSYENPLKDKENLGLTKSIAKENIRSDVKASHLKDKFKIRSRILDDLEQKMKIFLKNNNVVDYKAKHEIVHLSDKLEEETIKNERLTIDISTLKNENKLLGDIIDKLKMKADSVAENLKLNEDIYQSLGDYKQQNDELNKELEKYKRDHFDIENYKRQIEELKKEKDKIYIELEKERSSFENRLNDYKEQLQLRDHKMEERITGEVSNKHIINQNIEKLLQNVEKWKKLYMIEAKILINLQNQYKSIIEDSKCHMEYIKQLENQLQKQEASYFDLYSDYHQKLTDYRIESLKNIQNQLDLVKIRIKQDDYEKIEDGMMVYALEQELNKEKEKNNDYKSQINVLINSKEDLQRNLAIARTNLIELTEKLEEECGKVAALEDMRIGDMQYISSLESEL